MKIIDAHVHMHTILDAICNHHDFIALMNCANQKEWEYANVLKQKHKTIYLSFGIHPWQASHQEDLSKFLQNYQLADVIGEIGMDSVWCNHPKDIQEKMFHQQLSIAFQLKKPVILHTKGYENHIAQMISEFPNKYCVHWYSSEEDIAPYQKQDCYFTIGPFPTKDRNVKRIVKQVDMNRILMETDGIHALEWVLKEKVDEKKYISSCERLVSEIAEIKQSYISDIICQLESNFFQFVQSSNCC